jgi:hypothetical protein
MGAVAGVLLAVVLQHLIAGLGQLGAVLLQAGQNGEVALIDDRTAEALNVARTGRLLFRRATALLGEGGGRKRYRQECECKEKFTHHRPSFWQREIPIPNSAGAWERIAGAANRGIKPSEALVNAAKFAAARIGISDVLVEPTHRPNRLIFMSYLLEDLFRHGLLQETPADSYME